MDKSIVQRCMPCAYSKGNPDPGHGIMCAHPNHPGWMGGNGTEWALQCSDFKEVSQDLRIKEMPIPPLPAEAEKALTDCVELFELWCDGLFRKAGIEWLDGSEPPAISSAREVAAKIKMMRR